MNQHAVSVLPSIPGLKMAKNGMRISRCSTRCKPGMLGNTLTACWFIAGGFVLYYSIQGMFPTHLQKDLGLSPTMLAIPIMITNVVVLLSAGFWGWVADRFGRRVSMIIPGLLSIPLPFWFLLTGDYWSMVVGYVLMGTCGGGGMGGP